MKWTVSGNRTVAEDDKPSTTVEADSLEEAIKLAAPKLYGGSSPNVGEVFTVTVRVEVIPRPSLPLKSV